jgi:hypothetical protein
MSERYGSGPTLESLGELIRVGRVTTEGLWRAPDDSAERGRVGGLLAEIRSQATELGQSAMLPVCDTVSPLANAAPTPQAVEILLGGFHQLEIIWRKAHQS